MTLFSRDSSEGDKSSPKESSEILSKLYAENMTVSEGSLLDDSMHPIFDPDHELHKEVFESTDIEPYNPAEIDPNFANFLLTGGFQRGMTYFADVHRYGIDGANAKVGIDAANFLRQQVQASGIDVAVPLGAMRVIGRIGRVHRLFGRVGNKMRNITGGMRALGGGGGGSGGGTNSSGSPGADAVFTDDSYDGNRLSIDLPPTEIRLNTGIVAQTYSPGYQIGDGYQSPVHVTGVQFTLPSTTNSDAADPQRLFFFDSVLFDVKNTIQRNITFSPSTTLTDDDNLRNAFQALIYALSQYYAVSRFLVYGSNPMNKNECLLSVRDTITSTIGDKFMRLQRVLNGSPIPPNLNGLMYWLHQFYLSSEAPGSPVIMISPNSAMTSNLPTFAEIDTAISGLNSYNDTFALIGRAVPSWYATPLLTGNGNVVHDPSFSTVWTNLPISQSGTNPVSHSILGPAITSIDQSIYFNSWSDTLDGGAFGLTTVYNTSTSKHYGLMQPIVSTLGTNSTNRYTWFDATNKFYDAYVNDAVTVCRDETYTTGKSFVSAMVTALSFGAERCNGVTYRVVSECAVQLFDWIMSWDTVNSTVSPANKRKRRSK